MIDLLINRRAIKEFKELKKRQSGKIYLSNSGLLLYRDREELKESQEYKNAIKRLKGIQNYDGNK